MIVGQSIDSLYSPLTEIRKIFTEPVMRVCTVFVV